MDARKLEEGILKTGFHLEHKIATLLRKGGWIVISNRYYVDDQEDAVREMDLVVYKVRELAEFKMYTTLIISCKKSDKNIWALLARDRDVDDPNTDWQPTHIWSNDRAIGYFTAQSGWGQHYYARARELGVNRLVIDPQVDIFAYQEMNRESGAPQNDKPIFASVTSLMKAQSYEIGALPERQKKPSVYQFNLLSVVDADLARLYFDGAKVSASTVTDELYVARYIIRRKETSARIHFINAREFPKLLDDYRRLHAANVAIFKAGKEEFYRNILLDSKRTSVFEDEFTKAVLWTLNWRLRQSPLSFPEIKSVSISQSVAEAAVDVWLDTSDEGIQHLKTDSEAKKVIGNALKRIYRYEGPFQFTDDIPW
jgi:hypothetical protein